MLKKVAGWLAIGLVLVFCTLQFAGARWQSGTQQIRARLTAAQKPISPARYQESELAGLPAPVQAYFRQVLKPGQLLISGVHLRQQGQMVLSDSSQDWRDFTANQWVFNQRPGFDWDARVTVMPGVRVHVHDSYVAGEGILKASILGLYTVAHVEGARLAESELQRFLAEAAWYPTSLLPSQGVVWQAVDAQHARATLTDGTVKASLIFGFGASGLIESVSAEARGRQVGDQQLPTPWQGRFTAYQQRAGMLVPLQGEVGWVIQGQYRPYWRGTIVDLGYEFDPTGLSEVETPG